MRCINADICIPFYFFIFTYFYFMCKGHPDPEVSQHSRAPIQIPGNAFLVARCACRASLRHSIPRREKTFRPNQPTVISSVVVVCIVLMSIRIRIRLSILMPIQIRIRIGFNTMPTYMQILFYVLHILEIRYLYSQQC